MGRRFLLIVGMLVLALSALPLARAQDEGGGPPAPESTPVTPSDLPPLKPIELAPPDDRTPTGETPKPDHGQGAPSAKARVQDAPPVRNPSSRPPSVGLRGVPPLSPVAPDEQERSAGDPPRSERPSMPLADPALARTDGPAQTTGEPGADGPKANKLPAGKQTVAVTVDVLSPANMNLHQPATVRLVIHNTGTSDALQVRIRDELPEGLKYLSSDPVAQVESESVLSWSLPTLPAGSKKSIAVKIEPVKTGPLDHGASVWFQTGSKARTRVFQPRLKIEQVASSAKVLKGQDVEFKVRVTNIGDGPARKVTIAAKLSPGLRSGSSGHGADEMITEPIPVLEPNQSEDLDPLVVEAVLAGDQTCTVTATSRDVIAQDKSEEATNVATVTVVEPKLTLAVSGPQRRCTDTSAVYEIAVGNPGTAPARKVRVVAFVPPGARLLSEPKGARYDTASRRLQWSIDPLEAGPDPRKLSFEVKVGDVGKYEISAEAFGDGGLKVAKQILVTDVFGMPDVDLVVSERQRVVDVGGTTTFLIRLRNYGTKDANNILLNAIISKNLKPVNSAAPSNLEFVERDGKIMLLDADGHGIKRLGPGQELLMGLEVKVTGDAPKVASCRVTVTHDDLSEPYDDMAAVQVLPPSSRPADLGGP